MLVWTKLKRKSMVGIKKSQMLILILIFFTSFVRPTQYLPAVNSFFQNIPGVSSLVQFPKSVGQRVFPVPDQSSSLLLEMVLFLALQRLDLVKIKCSFSALIWTGYFGYLSNFGKGKNTSLKLKWILYDIYVQKTDF